MSATNTINPEVPISYDISVLHPQERCTVIRKKRERLESKIQELQPSFSIVFTGSSIYCLNPSIEECGNLDDIDSFIILPKGISYDQLFDQLKFYIDLDTPPSINHFEQLIKGDIGIIRASGKFEGLDVGFHIMTFNEFLRCVPPIGKGKSLKNVLPNRKRYTEKIFEESLLGGGSIYRDAEYTNLDDDLILLREFFARTLDDGRYTLGVLGDKFLSGKVVNEHPDAPISRFLVNAFRSFIRTSLFFNSDINNDEIISAFVRSKRFSNEFKRELSERIEFERILLKKRINNSH